MYEYYVVYVQYCGMVHAVTGLVLVPVQYSTAQYSSICESRPVRPCAKFDATHHVDDVMQ